jgi:hypothetical protein
MPSEKYEIIVTLLVRSDLSKMTPTEVLGEVQTHDLFKQSQKEVQGQSMNEEKKILLSRPRLLKKKMMMRTKTLNPMRKWLSL